jgi:hypothetical protein
MLAPFAPPRLGRFGGGFALQALHPRFVIAAEHQAALLIGLKRFDVQLTKGLGLGINVLIVAVEPVLPLMQFEVNVMEHAPDAGATERVRVHGVEDGRDQLIQGPPGDRACLLLGHSAGHRNHVDPGRGRNGLRAPRASASWRPGKPSARERRRHVPTVRLEYPSSRPMCRWVGWSPAAARKTMRARKANACGVVWARTNICRSCRAFCAQIMRGAIGVGIGCLLATRP